MKFLFNIKRNFKDAKSTGIIIIIIRHRVKITKRCSPFIKDYMQPSFTLYNSKTP